jgi:hypothetical protein
MAPPVDFILVVAEILRWGAGAAALLFLVITVLAAKEANTATMWGRPGVLAEVAEKVFPAVFALSVALAAGDLGAYVRELVASAPRSGASLIQVWTALVACVVQVCLMSVSLELAIAILTGTLDGQLGQILGQPQAVARGWTRVIIALLAGSLALLSPHIAQQVIQVAAALR